MSNAGKVIYLDETVFNEYNQEDVMLFPLKESEAQMLLAFVPFIKWRTRWVNSTRTQKELNDLAGSIADGLMNPQTGAEDMPTVADICEGVKCAITEVMTSAVAGLNSNVSVTVDPETGEIIVDTGQSGDGLTGTQNELRWGASLEVYDGLLEYIGDFSDFFTDYPLDEAQAVSFMSQKWSLTADITQAVSDYYDHRNLLNPHPQPLPSELKGEFFCYGATKQTTASYMIDNVSNDLLLLLSMLSALSQDQYDQWYSVGYSVPRLGFDESPCYRVPEETVLFSYDEITWNDWDTVPFTGKPSNHLWRLSVKCITQFVNANGDTWDGVYFTPSGGNPTLYNVQLFQTYLYPFDIVEQFGGQLPIGSVYVSEQQKASKKPNGIKFGLGDKTFTQGQLEITLVDLGAI